MRAKYQRKLQLMERLNNYRTEKNTQRLRKGFFYGFLSCYLSLRQRMLIIKNRCSRDLGSKVFGGWRDFTLGRVQKRRELIDFIRGRELAILSKYFHHLKVKWLVRREKLQRKKVAAVFFFRNFLAKFLFAFKLNRYKMRLRRDKEQMAAFMRVKRFFSRVREALQKRILVNRYLRLKERLRVHRVFSGW
jgi:hypothetical protein